MLQQTAQPKTMFSNFDKGAKPAVDQTATREIVHASTLGRDEAVTLLHQRNSSRWKDQGTTL